MSRTLEPFARTYLGMLPDWMRAWMVILVHVSLWIFRKLRLLAGTYLGMLPDWYKDLDGDPCALLFVDFQEVRDVC